MEYSKQSVGYPLVESGCQLQSGAAIDQSGALPDTAHASCIGPHVRITGDIEGETLRIEGCVIGDVRCATTVVGVQGVVTGTIHAHRVRVAGALDGAIRTNELAVEATARINGELVYGRIRVASGAVIEGQLSPQAPQETPDTDEFTHHAAPLQSDHRCE